MATDDITLGVYHPPLPPVDHWTEELEDYETAGWDSCWFPDQLTAEYPPSIWDPELTEDQ